MTKNTLLNLAILLFKVLQSFYIVAFLVLTALFIHIQVDGEFYKDKILTIENENITYNSSLTIGSENKGLTLDQMDTASLIINYIKFSGLLVLLFFAAVEFQRVIKSVKNLCSFQNENYKAFKRIGIYAFIYFLISSSYSYEFGQISYSGFTISLTPLIIMLFAFIMAEIFKEGNLLLEDKELTI